jgi:hypothetical protein
LSYIWLSTVKLTILTVHYIYILLHEKRWAGEVPRMAKCEMFMSEKAPLYLRFVCLSACLSDKSTVQMNGVWSIGGMILTGEN